ncbi:MAG: asparagine synthase (glutamine-hydrolyzing), partial [Chitinophagaceae bacterium]
MCGISGYYSFNNQNNKLEANLRAASGQLSKRGPDSEGFFFDENIGLAHRRLSILDTSSAGSQPMTTDDERYTLIFNGEIYNFQLLRKDLISKGYSFQSSSDTEVLLKMYACYGSECLQYLNGFFAFAVYDKAENELFIARDRMGIKPLLYSFDGETLYFASELKALLEFPVKRELDHSSLRQFFQFNYIPTPHSIIAAVKKLEPGTYLKIKGKSLQRKAFFQLDNKTDATVASLSYEDAKKKLYEHLDESVRLRLISDVPLGAFLSGGIDSSCIVALAAGHTKNLNTFSIGFKDNAYFDETYYANLVAQKYNTNHTVFKLSNDDLLAHIDDLLNYMDEPFADPSLAAVYILCKETRKKATVALSGDGADELMAGYNKHRAEWRARKGGALNSLLKYSKPILSALPKSRNNKYSDKIRQAYRFSEGLNLADRERYWRWCSYLSEQNASELLIEKGVQKDFLQRKDEILRFLDDDGDFNDVLRTDIHLLLPGQMLFKVDHMSMANSLEVRVPFLDHNLVEFVNSLPAEYKIDKNLKKRILQDTFREILPQELYNRPKHGFDVPLLSWFKKELNGLIMNDLLSDDFIEEQGIFNYDAIRALKQKMMSSNPEDVHAQIWA